MNSSTSLGFKIPVGLLNIHNFLSCQELLFYTLLSNRTVCLKVADVVALIKNV